MNPLVEILKDLLLDLLDFAGLLHFPARTHDAAFLFGERLLRWLRIILAGFTVAISTRIATPVEIESIQLGVLL